MTEPRKQHRRTVTVKRAIGDALALRAAQLGRSASSIVEEVCADLPGVAPVERPAAHRPAVIRDKLPARLTNGERDTLNALPDPPAWSGTESVVHAMRRKAARVSVLFALDTLRERGLARRRTANGGEWQRAEVAKPSVEEQAAIMCAIYASLGREQDIDWSWFIDDSSHGTYRVFALAARARWGSGSIILPGTEPWAEAEARIRTGEVR